VLGSGFTNDWQDDRSDSRGIPGCGFSNMHAPRLKIKGLSAMQRVISADFPYPRMVRLPSKTLPDRGHPLTYVVCHVWTAPAVQGKRI